MKSLSILIAFLIFSLTVSSQDKRDTIRSVSNKRSVMSPKEKRAVLLDSLDLSRDQTKKMKALNKELKAEAKELKENTQLSAADRKQKNRELIQKRQDEMKKILSPEQFDKYRRLQKQRIRDKDNMMMDDDES